MTMPRTVLAFALALAAAACGARSGPPAGAAHAAGTAGATEAPAAARVEPPPPLPMEPVEFPAFHERTLSNGARVIVVENHEQPVVTINLRVRSGTASDPRDKAGLANFTAALLDKGTATRSAQQIAQSIDFVGASLGAGAAEEWTNVGVTALTEFLDTALVILSDVVLNPSFPEAELANFRRRALSGLQLQLSQPAALAQRRFTQEVYGNHPYGKLETPQTLQAIDRSDLAAFHRAHFRPGNALFVVAGAVDPDDVAARLERHFGSWSGGAADEPTMFEPPARAQREVVLVHKPGSVQAAIRAGHLIAPATHPDWAALDVTMQILGGSFTGWLFKVLREEKGYTYSTSASAAKRPDKGYFVAQAEVRNEVVDSAMTELLGLLARVRQEPVPAGDLELARSYITGRFPRDIETPQEVAEQVAGTLLLGLPPDHLETYRDRIAAVTAADVQRVAREHIRPDEAVVVVVGDASQIYRKLTGFGTVRLVDTEGKPLSVSDIEVRAADVPFDPSGLTAQTLVYSLVVQGNPLGEVATTIGRAQMDGRDAVVARTTGGGSGFTLNEEIAFDAATFEAIHSRTEQAMGPMSSLVDLKQQNGRVTGTVRRANQEAREVDAEVVAGTLLPGMETYAIWLADFEAQKELKLPSFNGQTGSPLTVTIKVTGEGKVTVPAGEFEVYELDVQGEQRVKAFARKEPPHILVRQELWGQPVVIELKEIR